jgi:surface antigen
MKRLAGKLTVLALVLCSSGLAMAQNQGVLTSPEQQAMVDTFQHAMENNPTNLAADWVNPDLGNAGAVVPTKTFAGEQGQPCREFVTTITIGGRQEQGYGTACRQPDGAWQIVSSAQPTLSSPPAQTTIAYAPPPQYYYYPSGFYDAQPIYLSFGFVHRGGQIYRGSYFLDGPAFRYRYPLVIRERIYLGHHIWDRHHWYRERGHGERRWHGDDRGERRRDERGGKERREYRQDRWGDPDHGRGRGGRR